MNKLIIFDMDGVLVDAKKIHYDALNESLQEDYKISWDEHINEFDGLKTKAKLELLTLKKNLDPSKHIEIFNKKQFLTHLKLESLGESKQFINILSKLKQEGFKLGCCSNSIRATVELVLTKMGIINLFDIILSNEDVKNSKPHPEIYWSAMSNTSSLPENTLIIEDSPIGLLSAIRSGCKILRVKKPSEITLELIIETFNKNGKINNKKWIDKKLNVVIPMAGAGTRFEKAGFTFPKPLIEVNNKPMIQIVVDNISMDAQYIYIVQKKHIEKYNLITLLNLITPNCKIISVDGITEGAAVTALLAKEEINNENPLFFANSDQFVEWDSSEFMYKMQETDCDGGIVTFKSTHPKWSFVKISENGTVEMVAEKNPISNDATVGFYYWKHGSDFVKYSEQMIQKNIRVNNEFYVCPVFNEAISDNKKILTFSIDKMWGLGTPEDLDFYLKNYKNDK